MLPVLLIVSKVHDGTCVIHLGNNMLIKLQLATRGPSPMQASGVDCGINSGRDGAGIETTISQIRRRLRTGEQPRMPSPRLRGKVVQSM